MASKKDRRRAWNLSILDRYGDSATCPKCGRISEVSAYFGIPCGKCQRRMNNSR